MKLSRVEASPVDQDLAIHEDKPTGGKKIAGKKKRKRGKCVLFSFPSTPFLISVSFLRRPVLGRGSQRNTR